MTLLGKILTGLILIMSICFMMIAVTVSATHRNWRDRALEHKTKIEELTDTNQRLRDEQALADDRLAVEQAARRFALAALESRLDQLGQQLTQSLNQVSALQATLDVQNETLGIKTQNLANLTDEVNVLRGEIRAAQQNRDLSFNTVVVLTDTISGLQGSMISFQEREVQLRDQVSRMKLVMDAYEIDQFTPVVDIPPRVDGIITKVGESVLVEVSIGSDDGLREGHTLEVWRNSSYLGRVKVRHLKPDRAVCEIIPEFRKGIIKRGDRVATKLS